MLDKDEWPRVQAENDAELLAYVGTRSGLESYRADNITWVITGVPSRDYNGVVWSHLSEEDADLQVPLLVERFRMHQLPAVWHVDDTSLPLDLGHRLEQLECAPLPPRIRMAAPVVLVTRGMRNLPELSIERVTSIEDLAVWVDIWTETRQEPRAPREDLYTSLGLNRFEPLRHYLARLGGRPVGVSQLFLGQRGAGVHNVAVREEYHGLGLGTALVQQPLLEARTLGYDLAVLGPTLEHVPAYEALGFEHLPSTPAEYSLWP
ncbi:MAG: GNAT family N-acetyltransferase [Vicinamibacterales bacterium]